MSSEPNRSEIPSTGKISHLDKTDKQILEILFTNSREKFVAIAKAVNKTEATVRKRIENLRASGVIKYFTTEVNPAKIGYNVVAIVGVDVDPQNYLTATEKILRLESDNCRLISVYSTSGAHMIMFEIWTPDSLALNHFIENKIKPIKGITRVSPAILLERHKLASKTKK